jgi:hypothetical protein
VRPDFLKRLGLVFFAIFTVFPLFAVQEINVDVCVYAGTSGGVVAAVQAARMGKSVALVAQNNHLGGMTSSGLGWTDIGHVDNDSGDYIQGVAREFYNRVGQKYGLSGTKWTFEPHVAETVFNEMIQQAGVAVYTNQYLVSVAKQGTQIIAATMNNGNIFRAKEFIDASYPGDLMAMAGVSYTVGRESIYQYGESLNGVRPPNNDFTAYNIDPYIVPGNPASGLIPLLQTNAPGIPGSADQKVQAYNFRLCLTAVATNKIPITAPPDYNPNQFELVARYAQAIVAAGGSPSLSTFLTVSKIPNDKTDINNNGALSTDFVGESAPYIEADHATREQIWQAHRNYQQGLLYFLATDLRVPANVRNAMANYGFCKDEFADNGGWPYEFYVREARRMVSDYVMTQSNIFNQLAVPDAIGMGGYFTDSHYLQRVVISGHPRNEGDARGDISVPYPIAYRALTPKTNECSNLLVPWSLSASHTAFCSIRMEPVFMILGQVAGTAACFAIDENTNVQSVNLPKLQAQLVADKQAIAMDGDSSLIVDDADAIGVNVVGQWTSSSASSGYYGSDYLHDGDTNKGTCSVTFTPTLPTNDVYQVYVRWAANPNRASNVPIDIISPSGTKTVFVNQTQQGGQWVLLLTTNFNAGTTGKVRVRNDGTTGYVIADAVKFVEGENLPVIGLWPTDAAASRFGPAAGSITVTRSGNTNAPVTVNLNIGGSATNGSDYHAVGNNLSFPAGATKSQITILPYTNAEPVGKKTVIISVATNAAYRVGPLNSATVTIADAPLNAWRLNYFGLAAADESIAGDTAAPAGDGVPNLMKYALGLNPTQPATQSLITPEVNTNGYFQILYVRPDPPPVDVAYRLESSNDLANWCTNGCVPIQQILFGNNTAIVVSEIPTPVVGQPAKFVRLRVSRQ